MNFLPLKLKTLFGTFIFSLFLVPYMVSAAPGALVQPITITPGVISDTQKITVTGKYDYSLFNWCSGCSGSLFMIVGVDSASPILLSNIYDGVSSVANNYNPGVGLVGPDNDIALGYNLPQPPVTPGSFSFDMGPFPAGAHSLYFWIVHSTPWEFASEYYGPFPFTVISTVAPSTPTNLSATPSSCGTGRVTVNWNRPVVGSSPLTYTLKDGGNVIYTGTTNSYSHVGLPAGSAHTYTVSATNGAGSSAESGSVSASAPGDCLAPPTPIGISATPGSCDSNMIDVGWASSPGATGYTLYRNGIAVYSGPGPLFQDNTVTSGTTYTYSASARNAVGESAQTAGVAATAPYACDAPPIGTFDANCSLATGWTCDPNDWNSSLWVEFYEGSTFLDSTVARDDAGVAVAQACGNMSPFHGFSWTLPPWWADNTPHTISAYAQDEPNGEPRLLGSKTITCSAVGVPADLVPSKPTVSSASVGVGGTITFNTNTIRNNGTLNAGAHNVGGFYVDNNGDGTAEYTVAIPRQTLSTPAGGTYSRSVPWTVPGGAPLGNNYRIAYIVDVDNEVAEGPVGEGNNFSDWSDPFSVVAASAASCTGSIPLNASSYDSEESTGLAVNTPWAEASSDTAIKCQYQCNVGYAWNGASCVGPVITQLEVCLWNGTSPTSCGSSITVEPSTPLAIRWNSQNADTCVRQSGPLDFSTGGAISGSDTSVTASAAPNTSYTHSLMCSRAGSAASAVMRTVTVNTTTLRPVLTVSKAVVPIGDPITVSWDTNNGNEGACTLSGGGLTTATLTNGTGDAETGSAAVTIQGRTTFTLTCDALSDVKTVEIIPESWED